jgi:hypothetical protein
MGDRGMKRRRKRILTYCAALYARGRCACGFCTDDDLRALQTVAKARRRGK